MKTDNFDKLGKEDNILDRIEQAERRARSTARKNVRSARLSNLSNEIGEVDYRAVDTDGNLRVVMSAYDLFEELGLHAHLAGLDTSGVVQFYLSADDGKIYAAGGDVFIGVDGIVVANSTEAAIIFKDAAGNIGPIRISADSTNTLEFINLAESPSGAIGMFIKSSTGDTRRVMLARRHSVAGETEIIFEPASTNYGGRVSFGIDHFIDFMPLTATGEKTVYFNERNKNINFNIQGQADSNAYFLDASTDRSGFGTATPGYKVDVNGDVNVASGSKFKINGVNLAAPLLLSAHALGATVLASTTQYLAPGTTTIVTVQNSTLITVAGTLRNFYIRTGGAQPASGSLVCTVMVNGATSALTLTIAAGAAAGNFSDTTHSVVISATDRIGFQFVNNATGVSAVLGSAVVELDVETV